MDLLFLPVCFIEEGVVPPSSSSSRSAWGDTRLSSPDNTKERIIKHFFVHFHIFQDDLLCFAMGHFDSAKILLLPPPPPEGKENRVCPLRETGKITPLNQGMVMSSQAR